MKWILGAVAAVAAAMPPPGSDVPDVSTFHCCAGGNGAYYSNITTYGMRNGANDHFDGRLTGYVGFDPITQRAIKILGSREPKTAAWGWYAFNCGSSQRNVAITWNGKGCATYEFFEPVPKACYGDGTDFPEFVESIKVDSFNTLLRYRSSCGVATHAINWASCMPNWASVNLTAAERQTALASGRQWQSVDGTVVSPQQGADEGEEDWEEEEEEKTSGSHLRPSHPRHHRRGPQHNRWVTSRTAGHLAVVFANATAMAPPPCAFDFPPWCHIGTQLVEQCGV
jgi:hypothetical protein